MWHDSVVHVQRVQELCDGAEVQSQPELQDILRTWSQQMQRQAQDALDSASADMTANGEVLHN